MPWYQREEGGAGGPREGGVLRGEGESEYRCKHGTVANM
jgi:hypothetical protein